MFLRRRKTFGDGRGLLRIDHPRILHEVAEALNVSIDNVWYGPQDHVYHHAIRYVARKCLPCTRVDSSLIARLTHTPICYLQTPQDFDLLF